MNPFNPKVARASLSDLTRIFYKPPRSTPGALINTPLQRGATRWQDLRNRFNGFSRAVRTVETVSDALRTPNTPLKQGVNEKWWLRSFSRYEISDLRALGFSTLFMAATAFLQVFGTGTDSAGAAEPQFVYFGTYTGQKSKGIYRAQFDPATGKLSAAELAAETRNPTFVAVDPKRHFLYAVNEVNDFGKGNFGAVSAFKLDQKTGDLTFLNQQPSGGGGPCHLAVDPNGRCVLVANYGSGSVAVLPIESDGRVGEPSCSIQHHGSSVNPQRQEGPHAHFITWDPDHRVVLACDLGLDKVMLYQLDGARRVLTAHGPPSFAVKPGSGPRHLAFGKNGRYVYILNEIASTLTACSYDRTRGELQEIQTLSTLPADFAGANTCAEIELHPNGKAVYASNRGHNSIAVFGIDSGTGKVSLLQHEPTQGKTPRHFMFDPTGHWLLAENQDSDNVVVFAVDGETGRLTPTGISQPVGAPVCAVFVGK
jgi:6-phosphogluconolactonase